MVRKVGRGEGSLARYVGTCDPCRAQSPVAWRGTIKGVQLAQDWEASHRELYHPETPAATEGTESL